VHLREPVVDETTARSAHELDARKRKIARYIFASALGLAALLVSAGLVASQGSGDARKKPAPSHAIDGVLARGVNLSHWFSHSNNGYGDGHLSSFITEADAALMRGAGFTHVRVPVYMELAFKPEEPQRAFTAKLVDKVAMLNKAGLAVVVTMDANEDNKNALAESDKALEFIDGWRALARSFANFEPRLVLFELLNEPYPLAGAQWWSLQQRTVEAIRSVAPQNTIIANAGGWSGVEEYTANFSPLADANTIYTAHVYEPLLFTHQGATWVWPVAAGVDGVDWPLDSTATERAAQTGKTEEAVKQLDYQIGDRQFQVDWLLTLFDKLARWQQRSGAQIYIGEFGVYRAVAPDLSRLRWLKEVRKAFEARGWGWAVWDYSGGFAITQSNPPHRKMDPSVLDALGLQATASAGARH
jgi:aryl-phospho-beta-D-glucosidase BglC (GH1 family)